MGFNNEPTHVYNINLAWHSAGGEIVIFNIGYFSGNL
jgi:hypothetical protein